MIYRRLALIVNPNAGRRRSAAALKALVGGMSNIADRYAVHQEPSRMRIEAFARDLARNHDCLIAVGGDGTISTVVNGMPADALQEVAVGSVPTGRGRDTVRSL